MSEAPIRCPVTAIVTACQRIEALLVTLGKLRACMPAPAEIMVHLDGGEKAHKATLQAAFPEVRLLISDRRVGPGGGRNKLIFAASYPIVASFDDDSYPIDKDYFARLQELFAAFPEAAIITAAVFTRGQALQDGSGQQQWVANFMGGGCAYRKEKFVLTSGYVPLPVAYGMEEVDLALRMHAAGLRILNAPELRVYHDTDYSGHRSPALISGTVANAALLVYLRYPISCWPRGLCQVLNVAWYAVRHGRIRGVAGGFLMVPYHLACHRAYRAIVTLPALRSYLALRRSRGE